ncbi:hypothetical protein RRG08_001772 [Elysia crispata]|uniref:Uncharacterized protein n=1 Tax=Elysia crispata TaxID=231223 RepID=A0AAE1ALJ9_9GAST|nr:hypothetical protein RRG08_001772 [Elysia crispata]
MRYVKRSHEPSLGGGEMDFRRQDQVLDLRWEGKRGVNLLTTKLFPTRIQEDLRYLHRGLTYTVPHFLPFDLSWDICDKAEEVTKKTNNIGSVYWNKVILLEHYRNILDRSWTPATLD